jgi:hypothetical protein
MQMPEWIIKLDIPHVVIVSNSGCLRTIQIGEAKTPWTQVILDRMNGDLCEFRRYLGFTKCYSISTDFPNWIRIGQVAKYMFLGNIRHGFLTTYEQIIFLKTTAAPHGPHEPI